MQVGQRFGHRGIDHHGEPKSEASNVYGTLLDVNAIDALRHDVALHLGAVADHSEGEVNFRQDIHHTHREGTRADGGVTNLHIKKFHLEKFALLLVERVGVESFNEIADKLVRTFRDAVE